LSSFNLLSLVVGLSSKARIASRRAEHSLESSKGFENIFVHLSCLVSYQLPEIEQLRQTRAPQPLLLNLAQTALELEKFDYLVSG